MPEHKKCELCESPVNKIFFYNGMAICYGCYKANNPLKEPLKLYKSVNIKGFKYYDIKAVDKHIEKILERLIDYMYHNVCLDKTDAKVFVKVINNIFGVRGNA